VVLNVKQTGQEPVSDSETARVEHDRGPDVLLMHDCMHLHSASIWTLHQLLSDSSSRPGGCCLIDAERRRRTAGAVVTYGAHGSVCLPACLYLCGRE